MLSDREIAMPLAELTTSQRVFFVTCVLLTAMMESFFSLSKNGALKRNLYKVLRIFGTALVLCAVYVVLPPADAVFLTCVAVPVLAIIMWLDSRTVRFCDACGARSQSLFTPPRYCSKCGSPLTA